MSAQKLNYHLVAGKIVVKNETGFMEYPQNAVINSPDGCIGEAELSMASIALQSTFFSKFVDSGSITVVSVFVYSISPLGKMTIERFNRPNEKTPEEMAKEFALIHSN